MHARAAELLDLLGMRPHPEGGHYVELFRSVHRVQVLASQIYSDVGGLDWPGAAVSSYVLLALALIAIALFSVLLRAQTGTRKATWEYAAE